MSEDDVLLVSIDQSLESFDIVKGRSEERPGYLNECAGIPNIRSVHLRPVFSSFL